jgi:transcriptional antiterminator RfaH
MAEPGARRAGTAARAAQELAPGERWFVVQSQAKKESYAAAQLTNQGFRPFVPRVRKTVRHARKTRTALAALFPTYLFLALDLDRDRWRSVLGTFGVTTMIMAGERPRAVPHGVVEALADVVDGSGTLDFAERLAPGQEVRFLDGPSTTRGAWRFCWKSWGPSASSARTRSASCPWTAEPPTASSAHGRLRALPG